MHHTLALLNFVYNCSLEDFFILLYFQDRYGVGNSKPLKDTLQDWTVHEAKEIGDHVLYKISRPIDTCDKNNEDLVIYVSLHSVRSF